MKKGINNLPGIGISILAISVFILAGCAGPHTPMSHYINGAIADGYNNCQDCHLSGINDAPKEPTSHSGYMNDVCFKCHKSP